MPSDQSTLSFWSRRSIASILAAILLVTSTIVLGLTGMLAFRALSLREANAVKRQMAFQTRTLAEALALPLWNFDDGQMGRILDSSMGDSTTMGIRVRAGGRTWSRFRPEVQETYADKMNQNGFMVETREIRRDGVPLGTLETFYDTRYMQEEVSRFKRILLSGILGFDLILVLVLYLLIWHAVIKPIRSLEKFAEDVSSGLRPTGEPEGNQPCLEMNHLHRSIDGMVALLDQRYAKLMGSEQRFRALFNGSGDAMYMREFTPDNPRSPFVEVNEAACRKLGYTREELLRMNPYDISPESSAESVDQVRADLLANGSAVLATTHRTKEGRAIPVEVSAHRFEIAGRTFVLSSARDVSDRHRLENQLRHSQKMESLGMLAGGIAHDFNNILQVITSFGSLMREGLGKDDPNREKLGHILAAAEKASKLTRSLLTFGRKDSIEPKPSELNELVRRVNAFLKRLIGEDINLVTHPCAGPLDVFIDEGQIEQVLVNLVANARDAMPKGGTLTIQTDAVAMDEDFIRFHGFGAVGSWAQISVSDTGAGMDEATRLKIFDPFFTTKPAGKGTGLGLAIVYGIIQQHRGQINVYSEPGRGTTFRVYLPLHAQASIQAPDLNPENRSLKGTETILVAEDETVVREVIAHMLEEKGYTVIQASDGQEALERYAEHGDKIDLLLMDLIMPRLSGKDAYDRIRSKWPAARVIFSSGYTADIIQSRGDLDEGAELVMKPVAPRDLLLKIRDVLDRKRE
ncbi:MAG: multi-sensor hybrid histidine kinase [Holophagaceae bacterium]|nr:multi-sensor hybrid histidine kinase [Holophagaceae bacterium]